MKKTIVCLFVFAWNFPVYSQPKQPVTGSVEFVSDNLSKIINPNAKVETIAEGFQFTEGPLWIEKEKMLLFSDIPANTVYKWTEEKGKELYLKPGGYTGSEARAGFMGSNGLALSKEGKLLLCQHGDRRVAWMDAPLGSPAADFITIAAEHNGKKLNSPNDLFITDKGEIYFTDPSYGLERGGRDPKKEIPYHGVYRVNKQGQVDLLVDSLEQPNGIAIMPDGKTLLVSNSDSRKKRWYAYEISGDGSLKNPRIFFDVSNEKGIGGCDGFKIDKKGNVFATGPGGIWIMDKSGQLLGRIKIDGLQVANCALTPDDKTLFITASSYLLRVKLR